MVMEDSTHPNAQIVGREFVRQYYTLLNEAPKYLHRFYSSSSSFIHGGIDKPGSEAQVVYGQAEIHKKITELQFQDCHAKIRQVDSQPTVNSAVVVQVTGELSNAGGPMRRFMQTFVLAQQNPKQYYVHNDIFRYQDEVFDETDDEEADHEPMESEQLNGFAEPVETYHQQQHHVELPKEPEQQKAPTQHQPAAPVVEQTPKPAVPKEQPVEKKPEPPVPAAQPPRQPTPEKTEPVKPATKAPEPPRQTQSNEAPAPNKPISWANLVNKNSTTANTSSGSAAVAVVNPMTSSGSQPAQQQQQQQPAQQQAPQQQQQASPAPADTSNPQQQMEDSSAGVANEEKPPVQPGSRGNRSSAEPGVRRGGRPDDAFDRRNNERYPDSQQVFVGNLPVDIAELTLRKFFGKYGKVIECRINRGQPDKKVPFGFVVFDNEEPVKELLSMKRVEMDGHRLNVEEKKARGERNTSNGRDRPPRGPRMNRANSRPKDRDNSNSRGNDNKQPSAQQQGQQSQAANKNNPTKRM